jgi:hypothetical protein
MRTRAPAGAGARSAAQSCWMHKFAKYARVFEAGGIEVSPALSPAQNLARELSHRTGTL